MTRCDDCRPLLLDRRYGLLDPDEAAAVDAHLASCPACAAADAQAAREHDLLARAAKLPFPEVVFAAPPVEPAAAAPTPLQQPTVVVAAPTPAPARRGWVWWAVAASLLALAPAAAVRVSNAVADRDDAAVELAKLTVGSGHRSGPATEMFKASDPARTTAAARQAHDALLAEWAAAEEAALRANADRKLAVEVRGPAAVHPGAPNEFKVVVHDHTGTRGTHHLEAEVRDGRRVLLRQKIDPERAGVEHPLRLPADVWARVTPDSDLTLAVTAVDEKTGGRTELQEHVRLLGPVFTTFLTTDKPLYRPGESVLFRSLTLDRATFRAPDRDMVLRFELLRPNGQPVPGAVVEGLAEPVRVVDGRVEPVAVAGGPPVRGVGCGAFALPADLPSGEYTLAVSEVPHPAGYSPAPRATRTIEVRSFAPDRFQKDLGFAAASFAPGGVVDGWCELKDNGRPAAGVRFDAVAVADGQTVYRGGGFTRADGRGGFRFPLPASAADRGDVRLRVTFHTRPNPESVARRVPVAGRDVIVEFFPEGGDLVAGVPCRVYVRATTPGGQPAEIRGAVTDGRTDVVDVVTSNDPTQPGANRGLGEFTFTPKLGVKYRLRLDSPAAAVVPAAPAAALGAAAAVARPGVPLPAVKADGVVMSVPDGVTSPGQPVRVRLWSVGMPRNLVVGAYTRGRPMDTKRVTVEPGRPAEIELMADANPRGGVTRITTFEEPADDADPAADLKPVAERLVFRRPGDRLDLSFAAAGPGGKPVAPGGEVDFTLTAKDEAGRPAAAVLWAAVVNENVVKMAEGKRDRLMTAHFLLAGEVQTPDDLEHADFLLGDHPAAAGALDLLLGTQGWRRFAEQHPTEFRREHVVNLGYSDRMVAGRGYGSALTREQQRLYEAYWPKYQAAVDALDSAVKAEKAKAAEPPVPTPPPPVVDARRDAVLAAEVRLAAADERLASASSRLWATVAGLGVAAGGLTLFAAVRPAAGRRAAAGAAVVALTVAAAAAVWLDRPAERLVAVGPAAAPADPVPAAEPPGVDTERLPTSAAAPPANGGAGLDGFGVAASSPPAAAEARKAPVEAQSVPRPAPNFDRLSAQAAPAEGGPAFQKKADQKAGVTKSGTPAPAVTPFSANSAARPNGPPGAFAGGGGGMNRFGPPGPANAAAAGRPGVAMAAPGAPPMAPPTAMAVPNRDAVAGRPAVVPGFAGVPIPEKELRQVEQIEKAPPALMAARLADGGTAAKAAPEQAKQAAAPNVRDEQAAAAAESGKLRSRQLQLRITEGLNRSAEKGEAAGAVAAAAKRNALDLEAVGRIRRAVPQAPLLVVREYAHARPEPDRDGADKLADRAADATPDTVLWQPVLVAPGGTAALRFRVGVAPAGYQVLVAGHTADGRLGAARGVLRVAPVGPASSR